jgi:acyl dehydratase
MSQRRFDDVSEGDQVDSLVRQPDEETAINFFGKDNPFNPVFRDRETAKRQGLPGTIVPGMLKLAFLSKYAADWAGPEGKLVSVRAAYKRPDIAGNPLNLVGTVVRKYEEDGRALVDLELAILTEDGQPSTQGAATVELPR